jgi:hypothetical protein
VALAMGNVQLYMYMILRLRVMVAAAVVHRSPHKVMDQDTLVKSPLRVLTHG